MMTCWLRDKYRGLGVFLLVAGLVIGGLGWVTAAVLRLEADQWLAQAQALQAEKLHAQKQQRELENRSRQKKHEANVRLALWQLDSLIAPLLAREETRPYAQYSALFAPSVVLDGKGQACEPASVLEPSPLLNAELPDWMLLHFQASIEGGWSSPQVLASPTHRSLGLNYVPLSNVTVQRRDYLEELSQRCPPRQLLGLVQAQQERFADALTYRSPRETSELLVAQTDNDKSKAQLANTRRAQDRFQRTPPMGRGQLGKTPNNDTQEVPFEEHAYTWANNTRGSIPGDASGRAVSQQVLVKVGPLIPVWLDNTYHGKEREPVESDKLVLARVVQLRNPDEDFLATALACSPAPNAMLGLAGLAVWDHGGRSAFPREVCQGILLDWTSLRELLAESISETFPDARFRPLRSNRSEPERPERTMTTLPVELDPGVKPAELPPQETDESVAAELTVPDLGWTPLRMGLGVAWVAALVALSAVGLGGWSLIDLSQRRIRFVSAVTHELRTPLTTLRLYLEMLTGGMVQEEEQKQQYLETLHTESERLNRLVSNVLDFSRLENQRPALELAPVRIDELFEQVRSSWRKRCEDAGKELILDNQLPDDREVVTDLHLTEQVLGNLIDNACKYSQEAEDRRLWLRARQGDRGRVWLEVEDRGPGVPCKEQRSIFRPFRRGRGAETKAGGVGLGLALADRWARLLGGSLTVRRDSTCVGACFRVELR
jgi:two-component sensor histidine kinase